MAAGKARRAAGRSAEQETLRRELTHTRARLDRARQSFQLAREPELIDACIFEINALQARCCYLLRLAKEGGAGASGL